MLVLALNNCGGKLPVNKALVSWSFNRVLKEKGVISEEYYRVDVVTPFVYLLFTSVLAFWPFMM